MLEVYGLLIGVASLVVERRLSSAWTSVVVVHRLSSKACGIFPDQGPNPCPLHWQVGASALDQEGGTSEYFLNSYEMPGSV